MKPVLYALLPGIFLFSCCKPDESVDCPDAKTTTVSLTDAEKAKVPYTGFDTLTFLGINGDTHIVVGKGKQYYYDKEYNTLPPDCPQNDIINKEAYKIEYNPIKGRLSYTLSMRKILNSVDIINSDYPFKFSQLIVSLGFKPNNPEGFFLDSISLNGHIFYNVHIFSAFEKEGSLIAIDDTSYQMYYTINDGMIMMKNDKKNELFKLIKK